MSSLNINNGLIESINEIFSSVTLSYEGVKLRV
jgi:hypothetical protein